MLLQQLLLPRQLQVLLLQCPEVLDCACRTLGLLVCLHHPVFSPAAS
jgi:hypothetical protein